MGDEATESLRRLEDRLGRATKAAEEMMAEAARSRGADKPPPAGWQAAGEEQRNSPRPMPELEALISAVASLRELIPPEVAERVLAAVREVLLALRSLLDYYLERLERRSAERVEVQDIPIS